MSLILSKRRRVLTAVALAMPVVAAAAIVQSQAFASAPAPHKSYVCKYVTKPGTGEVLQTGQNPIWVDNNALLGHDGTTYVGESFSDAQGRSVVIVANTPRLTPEPSVSECPTTVPPTPTPSPSSSETTPTPSNPVTTPTPTTTTPSTSVPEVLLTSASCKSVTFSVTNFDQPAAGVTTNPVGLPMTVSQSSATAAFTFDVSALPVGTNVTFTFHWQGANGNAMSLTSSTTVPACASSSSSPSVTPTVTPTPSVTPTVTPTPTPTPSVTPTGTPTVTPTVKPSSHKSPAPKPTSHTKASSHKTTSQNNQVVSQRAAGSGLGWTSAQAPNWMDYGLLAALLLAFALVTGRLYRSLHVASDKD